MSARSQPGYDECSLASADVEPSAAVELVKIIAGSDWTDIDLDYAAVNVRYARGSLDRETRRTASSAIRTLLAILREARALQNAAPVSGSAEGVAVTQSERPKSNAQ